MLYNYLNRRCHVGKKRSYTDGELAIAVRGAVSIRQVLVHLGLSPNGGGSYAMVKKHINRLNLNTSHFIGRGHLRGKTHSWNYKYSLEEMLVKNSTLSRGTLKKRLIKEGLLEEECSICGLPNEWRGKKLVMILDHKNGIKNDNSIENLRLVCPNCNSQLNTFSGRNKWTPENEKGEVIDPATYTPPSGLKKKDGKKHKCKHCGRKYFRNYRDQRFCSEKCYHDYLNTLPKCRYESCGKPFEPSGNKKKFCSSKCYHAYNFGRPNESARKIVNRPSKGELQKMIAKMTWCAIGRRYGVSDNAIRKWARSYGLL
jgi:hypothetical protein